MSGELTELATLTPLLVPGTGVDDPDSTVGGRLGVFALAPSALALLLCFMLRRPLPAIWAGAILGFVIWLLLPAEHSSPLFAWLPLGTLIGLIGLILTFGILLGLWQVNGAATAFADSISRRFVTGPRSAKLAAWVLGVLFFQGGAFSAMLVGSVVKPTADRHRVSHEELAYVVDATASPVSLLIPLNAWPFYVQGFIAVSGVTFLATTQDRIIFYLQSIPLFFFAVLSVLFTFLLARDQLPFMGRRFREAVRRSRHTGELDAPGARPLAGAIMERAMAVGDYRPRPSEFFIAIGGVLAAFGVGAWLVSPTMAFPLMSLGTLPALAISMRGGVSAASLIGGIARGLIAVAPVCLLLIAAVLLGSLSSELGAGHFVSQQLGGMLPPVLLPLILFLMSAVLALSTGSSWGTFALVLPFALPLAWAVAIITEAAHPQFLLMLCLAAAVNGSVFGDQCSPLSDTTIVSSVATGCDVMDHVRTQLVPSAWAALFAVAAWTLLALWAV